MTFSFIQLKPCCFGKITNVDGILGSIIQFHLLDDRILFAAILIFFFWILSQFYSMLVENSPFTFCLRVVEFLMDILNFPFFGFFQILNAQIFLVAGQSWSNCWEDSRLYLLESIFDCPLSLFWSLVWFSRFRDYLAVHAQIFATKKEILWGVWAKALERFVSRLGICVTRWAHQDFRRGNQRLFLQMFEMLLPLATSMDEIKNCGSILFRLKDLRLTEVVIITVMTQELIFLKCFGQVTFTANNSPIS